MRLPEGSRRLFAKQAANRCCPEVRLLRGCKDNDHGTNIVPSNQQRDLKANRDSTRIAVRSRTARHGFIMRSKHNDGRFSSRKRPELKSALAIIYGSLPSTRLPAPPHHRESRTADERTPVNG
jgi:hypothetical protein